MGEHTSETPIGHLIDEYIARGVFRAAALPAKRKQQEQFRIVWFQDQAMTLIADHDRGEVTLHEVMPALTTRSQIDRELREWLIARTDKKLPDHRRYDRKLLSLKLSNRNGSTQLTVATLKKDLLFATRKLLHLTNELYLDFLSAPERYNWILDTFELDPDNPRWP